jgi:tetratricopeptide (TPR) repeat protein
MAKRAKTEAKQAAEAYRNLGAIAGLADPKRAREVYQRAVELDPDNVDALLWLGWLDNDAGALEASERAFRRVLALTVKTPDGRDGYWARLGLADIRAARGDLSAAMAEYRQAQAIADRLALVHPGNAGWQRDLAISHGRVAQVVAQIGERQRALDAFEAGRAIILRLRAASPDNATLPKDLAWFEAEIAKLK